MNITVGKQNNERFIRQGIPLKHVSLMPFCFILDSYVDRLKRMKDIEER